MTGLISPLVTPLPPSLPLCFLAGDGCVGGLLLQRHCWRRGQHHARLCAQRTAQAGGTGVCVRVCVCVWVAGSKDRHVVLAGLAGLCVHSKGRKQGVLGVQAAAIGLIACSLAASTCRLLMQPSPLSSHRRPDCLPTSPCPSQGLLLVSRAVAASQAASVLLGALSLGLLAARQGAPGLGCVVAGVAAAACLLLSAKLKEYREHTFLSGLAAWQRSGGLSLVPGLPIKSPGAAVAA